MTLPPLVGRSYTAALLCTLFMLVAGPSIVARWGPVGLPLTGLALLIIATAFVLAPWRGDEGLGGPTAAPEPESVSTGPMRPGTTPPTLDPRVVEAALLGGDSDNVTHVTDDPLCSLGRILDGEEGVSLEQPCARCALGACPHRIEDRYRRRHPEPELEEVSPGNWRIFTPTPTPAFPPLRVPATAAGPVESAEALLLDPSWTPTATSHAADALRYLTGNAGGEARGGWWAPGLPMPAWWSRPLEVGPVRLDPSHPDGLRRLTVIDEFHDAPGPDFRPSAWREAVGLYGEHVPPEQVDRTFVARGGDYEPAD